MTQQEFEHQMALIDIHLAKGQQCLEYDKLDDAYVHLKIARILNDGLEKRFNYEKESLLNLAGALTN